VIARRQLGDHPTVNPVQIDLAVDLVRQQAGRIIKDRDGGFITGRFEGQDAHV
jgi:hypothetical protein